MSERKNLFAKWVLLSFIMFLWEGVPAKPLAFAEIFGEQMVLQQKMPITIWGTSNPYATICVTIENRRAEQCADSQGNWTVVLPELRAGGPYRLNLVSGTELRVIDSVYVGEVWIAAGQSNMGFQVFQLAEAEKQRAIVAAKNAAIHFMTVPKRIYEDTISSDNNRLEWKLARGKQVEKMSAVAYFFAQKLQSQINVPLGVIITPHGGSTAEAWLPREILRENPITNPLFERYQEYMAMKGEQGARDEYYEYLRAWNVYYKGDRKSTRKPRRPYGPYSQSCPGGLYETMLKRIIPYTARGVLWYQGESNNSRAEQYRVLLPMLIKEWRQEFHNPGLYFCVVQLPAYKGPKIESWPEIREAQLLTARSIPYTALVVTIDAGERDNLHPLNKRPVGERLAVLAANNVYGILQPHKGPELESIKCENDCMILTFDPGGGGLTTWKRKPLCGFYIAEKEGDFVEAHAEIDGNRIRVWSEVVAHPDVVRYGWANWTECNLCNEAGYPASPFRTDDRPLLTTGLYR